MDPIDNICAVAGCGKESKQYEAYQGTSEFPIKIKLCEEHKDDIMAGKDFR